MDEEAHAAAHASEFRDVHSFRDLMAVAISGGLVPCPMGVLIVIFSMRPDAENTNVLRCLTYLISFSLGLGGVITGLALAMVLFRDVFSRVMQSGRRRTFFNLTPLFSAVAVIFLGAILSYEAFDENLLKLRQMVFGP